MFLVIQPVEVLLNFLGRCTYLNALPLSNFPLPRKASEFNITIQFDKKRTRLSSVVHKIPLKFTFIIIATTDMSLKLFANDCAIKKNETHQYHGKILIITHTSKCSHPQSNNIERPQNNLVTVVHIFFRQVQPIHCFNYYPASSWLFLMYSLRQWVFTEVMELLGICPLKIRRFMGIGIPV